MEIQKLPENVLSRQLCCKCGNYLSIGPVTISHNGDVVCGRCPKDPFAVPSLYNTIAEKFRFKCINHYAGCDSWLLFGEQATAHEAQCTYKANYDCPFCKFKGTRCELVSHFGALHVNRLVRGDTVDQIISYKDPDIDYILDLNDTNLQLFVNTALGLFAKCDECKELFSGACVVYVCPKYHSVCAKCSLHKCLKCNDFCRWNKKSRLHRILVPCEWNNCKGQTNIFTYLSHKQICKFRPYKCPDEDCGYVSELEKLKNHWHLNPLKLGDEICVPSKSCAFYWLIPRYNELAYVTVNYDDDDEMVVMIAEYNFVYPGLFNYFVQAFTRTLYTEKRFLFNHDLRFARCTVPGRYKTNPKLTFNQNYE